MERHPEEEYRNMPLTTITLGRAPIGVLVMLETHRRVFGNKFGSLPRPLSDDAFSMKGYCLDAPDAMPAGACYYDEFAPPEEDDPPCTNSNWICSQRLVHREET